MKERNDEMKQLYYHADVITMEENEQGELITAQAVLTEDGKIKQVGSLEELLGQAGEDCEKIDCQGGTLLPAFLDPHSHITALAQTLSFCDLSGCRSFAEISDRMLRFAQDSGLGEGDFLVAFDYDHNDLQEGRHPDRHLLDRISQEIIQKMPDHFPGNEPKLAAAISHASGHMGVLNTAALQQLGVTRTTPDPEGGRIGREEDGEPSGYLEENAFIQLTAKLPQPSHEQTLRNLERAQEIYWQNGIATIQDGLTKPENWQLLQELAEQGRLKSDVVCYADLRDHRELLRKNPDYCGVYRHHLRMGGYKIFLDGSPQGRTAWVSELYLGGNGECGYPIYSDEQVTTFVEQALEDHQQLLAHCNGDAAAQQYLDACSRAGETAEIRPVMIHAQLLRPDQLPQLKKLGMIPSYFVAHTWFWGDVHRQNLGEERAQRISPLHSTIEQGIPFTLHQDTPVIPPDMMKTLWCAVNRRSKSGASMGEQERISPAEALKAITVNAAYQYFEEDIKGSIRPGKQADLVLLSANPLQEDREKLAEIKVLRTISAGEIVYHREDSEKNSGESSR